MARLYLGLIRLEFDSGAVKIGVKRTHPLFKLALVLVRFDHIARFIVNANHSVM